ncbi:unnamed protein product [Durusdinium trenchii]|uniref:RRM domain-containing protein n=1 Tax=Durusdinium trenchii TaxID=1381693 RepID=A0ABP0MJK5_9DINO
MQNMNLQGMNLQMINSNMPNMQWQANVASQGPQCGPSALQTSCMQSSMQGNSQASPMMPGCQSPTIFATPMQTMQNVQFIQVPAGMQLMPMNCSGMMVANQNNGNGNFEQQQMVKNNFMPMENQVGVANGTRLMGETPNSTPEGSEEDFVREGVKEDTNRNSGQYLVISGGQSSLKDVKSMGSNGLSMEQQLQQLQMEQQQLLQHHRMQQQALAQQQQMELLYHSQALEALQHTVTDTNPEEIQETDDEDCIGQYPHHQGPLAPTEGAMAWMAATLEGMQTCAPKSKKFNPTASADTGSTPEPHLAKKKLVVRKPDGPQDAGSGASSGDQAQLARKKASDPWSWEDGVVTVMVRQLPRQYTQRMLLQEVVRRGFEGLFDFLYLPYDFKKGINVGYGFVNFTEPEYALQFRDSLDGQYLDKYMRMKGKAVRVHPAQVQGYEANYRHFAHTKTGQKQDPAFSPLFFSVGDFKAKDVMKMMEGQENKETNTLVEASKGPSLLALEPQKHQRLRAQKSRAAN